MGMSEQEIQELQGELIQYVSDVGDGKDLEILSIEIRHKIDVLNEKADSFLDLPDGKAEDFQFITGICYQYYRLLYG